MAKKRRRKNAFVRYFVPFGLRQICDLLLLSAAIVLIVGMCIYETATTIVLLVGLIMFALGSLLAMVRAIRVLTSGINKRAPEYKHAIVNTVLMGIMLALAVVGIIYWFI